MPTPANPPPRTGLARFITPAIAVALLVLVGFAMRGRGAAPIPPAFDATVTLAQAAAAAKAANQPVLVFATADWCGPCQMLKRGALADARVTDAIKGATQPVYLDVDKSRDQATELGVRSIPVLILMRDDKTVDRLEGVHDADGVLAWLQRSRP